MDFYDVVKTRRSIRKFKPDPISDEIVERILNAARLAPTWANMQGTQYIVGKDPKIVENLCQAVGQRWLKEIPMFIVVGLKESDSGKNSNGLPYFLVDAAICMEHIILAATNEGLGTCWIGHFPEEKVQEVLGISKKVRVVALTPLGYPNETPREQSRKNLNELVSIDRFGNRT